MKIRIVGIRTNFDLRGIHKSRIKFGSRCKASHDAFLLVNRARTSFRLIDCLNNVHTFYLEKGNVLDTDRIVNTVKAFGGLEVTFPGTVRGVRTALKKAA